MVKCIPQRMFSSLQDVFADMLEAAEEEDPASTVQHLQPALGAEHGDLSASEDVVYGGEAGAMAEPEAEGEAQAEVEAEFVEESEAEVEPEEEHAGAGAGGIKRPREAEMRPRPPDSPPPTRLVRTVRFPALPPPPPPPPPPPAFADSAASAGGGGLLRPSRTGATSSADPAGSSSGAKPAGMTWPEWRRLNPTAARRSEAARSARLMLRAAAREEVQTAAAQAGSASAPRVEHRVNPCPGCVDNEGKVGCSFTVAGPGGGPLCGVCCRARHGSERCAVHRPWPR